jgi:DNA-binding transcriptional MerR regulator
MRVFPDINPRTLISWSEKGLFTPEVLADGSGTRRAYTVQNLVEIGIIHELVTRHTPHQLISLILYNFSNRKDIPADFDEGIIIAMISGKLPKNSALRRFETSEIKIVPTKKISETLQKIHSANSKVTYVSIVFVSAIWEKVEEMVQET